METYLHFISGLYKGTKQIAGSQPWTLEEQTLVCSGTNTSPWDTVLDRRGSRTATWFSGITSFKLKNGVPLWRRRPNSLLGCTRKMLPAGQRRQFFCLYSTLLRSPPGQSCAQFWATQYNGHTRASPAKGHRDH